MMQLNQARNEKQHLRTYKTGTSGIAECELEYRIAAE
jgi:hypothetical protein